MIRRFVDQISLAALATAALLVAPGGTRAQQIRNVYQWPGNYAGPNPGVANVINPGGPIVIGAYVPPTNYVSPGYYSRWAYMGDTGGIVTPVYSYAPMVASTNYLYGSVSISNATAGTGSYQYGSALNSDAYYTRDLPALINLNVPADARVWFDGTETKQAGSTREFITPPLATGSQYHYDVKVQWMEHGKEMTRTRRIQVQPGATVNASIGQDSQP